MANALNKEKQAIVIGALAEGNSIRSIERLSGIHRDTIQYSAPAVEDQRKYSPAHLTAVFKTAIVGDPNSELVCTSYIERANLTVRTHCKRLARLTLAFSKKLENFKAAMALHLAYYNFVKTHGTVRCTPAMAAGIESSHWTIGDLI